MPKARNPVIWMVHDHPDVLRAGAIIAGRHGGEIEPESNSVETRFKARLPLTQNVITPVVTFCPRTPNALRLSPMRW